MVRFYVRHSAKKYGPLTLSDALALAEFLADTHNGVASVVANNREGATVHCYSARRGWH